MTQRQADINRALLSAQRDMGTATLDEMALSPKFELLKPSREELATAYRDCLTYAYIDHPIPGDSEFSRITDKGLRQINRDGVALDAAVWGRHAAR